MQQGTSISSHLFNLGVIPKTTYNISTVPEGSLPDLVCTLVLLQRHPGTSAHERNAAAIAAADAVSKLSKVPHSVFVRSMQQPGSTVVSSLVSLLSMHGAQSVSAVSAAPAIAAAHVIAGLAAQSPAPLARSISLAAVKPLVAGLENGARFAAACTTALVAICQCGGVGLVSAGFLEHDRAFNSLAYQLQPSVRPGPVKVVTETASLLQQLVQHSAAICRRIEATPLVMVIKRLLDLLYMPKEVFPVEPAYFAACALLSLLERAQEQQLPSWRREVQGGGAGLMRRLVDVIQFTGPAAVGAGRCVAGTEQQLLRLAGSWPALHAALPPELQRAPAQKIAAQQPAQQGRQEGATVHSDHQQQVQQVGFKRQAEQQQSSSKKQHTGNQTPASAAAAAGMSLPGAQVQLQQQQQQQQQMERGEQQQRPGRCRPPLQDRTNHLPCNIPDQLQKAKQLLAANAASCTAAAASPSAADPAAVAHMLPANGQQQQIGVQQQKQQIACSNGLGPTARALAVRLLGALPCMQQLVYWQLADQPFDGLQLQQLMQHYMAPTLCLEGGERAICRIQQHYPLLAPKVLQLQAATKASVQHVSNLPMHHPSTSLPSGVSHSVGGNGTSSSAAAGDGGATSATAAQAVAIEPPAAVTLLLMLRCVQLWESRQASQPDMPALLQKLAGLGGSSAAGAGDDDVQEVLDLTGDSDSEAEQQQEQQMLENPEHDVLLVKEVPGRQQRKGQGQQPWGTLHQAGVVKPEVQ